jgi:general secretion pathway protein G
MPCDPVHPAADPANQHAVILNDAQRSGQAGFSLIEVMVTIVIIGLLSTVVLINVLPSRDKAMVEKAKTDIAVLEQAIDTFKLEMLSYPKTEDGLEALVTPPASLSSANRFREGGYIRRLPEDPWGNAYRYAYPGRAAAFDVYSLGADGQPGGEGLDADIGNWN